VLKGDLIIKIIDMCKNVLVLNALFLRHILINNSHNQKRSKIERRSKTAKHLISKNTAQL
jgi:hypothetical protein